MNAMTQVLALEWVEEFCADLQAAIMSTRCTTLDGFYQTQTRALRGRLREEE
jgi:hypothetical protein